MTDATSTSAAALYSGSLGSVSPDDVAISADGSLIYAAGAWTSPGAAVPVNDGDLRIYSAATGQLVDTIHVGTRLGAIDLSPDGQSLLVTELATGSSNLATVYDVNVTTHAVQTFNFTTTAPEVGPFTDVAALSDGTALLSLGYAGSGGVQDKILNLATGVFSNGPSDNMNSFLTPSTDGSEVLIADHYIGDAGLQLYQTGHGIIADNQNYYPRQSSVRTSVFKHST